MNIKDKIFKLGLSSYKKEKSILREVNTLVLSNNIRKNNFIFACEILNLAKSVALDFHESSFFDEKLIRVINRDLVILSAFHWCYYAVKNILIENKFDNEEIKFILSPLMVIQLTYIFDKNADKLNTLAAKANPDKFLRELQDFKDFESIGIRYVKSYRLRGFKEGSLRQFHYMLNLALYDEHPMYLKYMCENCGGLKMLEGYFQEYANNAHQKCEKLLIKLVS